MKHLNRGARGIAVTAAGALAAMTLGSAPAHATLASAEPDPAHLLAHYDFDGDPATTGTVVDRSGHSHDATVVNKATASAVPGAEAGDSALDLPGGSQSSTGAYVDLPKNLLDGATDLTVSARVKWDGSGGSWQRIFDIGQDTSHYLFAAPTNGDGNLRAAVKAAPPGDESYTTGYAALPSDAWKTVTVTLDTAKHRISLYLDGAYVDQAATDVTAAQLLNSSATRGGYIGKSQFGADPLFSGAVDDFQVYDTSLPADQVAQLVDTPPTLTKLADTSFDVRTNIGEAPSLPANIRATYSDGFDRNVPTTWDDVDPAKYAALGTFTVHGSAGGQDITAEVTVTKPNQLTVDLSKNTGAFHGGASGTLYGVYGAGVPTSNLLEGMRLRTVATKAQDGQQHPGADALDVVKPLADSSGGDTYIYMTDIYRGFPYQWPGDTPEAKLDDFKAKIATQVDQVLTLPKAYQKHVVFVPFNEPEGNMFGTGDWSYDKVSWLDDPTDYFKAWDDVYALIKGKMPDARIAGPNTSVLYTQIQGYLKHVVAAKTVPDVMTWHELSNPASIRSNVAKYRTWEAAAFDGTAYAGKKLPINIDEYAFNYHTSVPGQMIQWVSAIEDSKVDADIAYWNIDGNLSDSAVQANRGNGQWWLLNAYGNMTGHTVAVNPPRPNANYTLQGVATYDPAKSQARAILGGASGKSAVEFDHVDAKKFGNKAHVLVQEIPWTGQLGDSPQPATVAEYDASVKGGTVALDFGEGKLPALKESSAYQVILTPGKDTTSPSKAPKLWQKTYEAEDATYTGGGYSKNGPEGSPNDVSKFYTSGGYDIGGLRTGSDGVLSFKVSVPKAGTYDLSVFADSLNTYDLVAEQGPTNVFLNVDGAAEQEMFLPLGYKWSVWDHSDTTVKLTAGDHVISLAAKSLDGSKSTKGDAIIDKMDLSLANPAARTSVYQAENAVLKGAKPVYNRTHVSGSGVVPLGKQGSATFWVYSAKDGESTLSLKAAGHGSARWSVNGKTLATVTGPVPAAKVFLRGGINKIVVTGHEGSLAVDSLGVRPSKGTLPTTSYEAEAATIAGTAKADTFSLASGGKAVTGIGGAPGNGNTLTFKVTAAKAGVDMVTVRYSNPEQSPATHYNPDPLARHADVKVNGGTLQRVWFPHSFHQNNFWELSFPVTLVKGKNTIRFSSEELPNFDGKTYASDLYEEPLRSKFAPNIDRIRVTPLDDKASLTSRR
ncbi:cellulosome enzyme [Aeromicrobium sp. Root344]|uniref:LamG-like jellyroll fold domain-containing protein n=1 Tax=Aeromicrobium sp. Root344 TaxID=1736521 RepID=UPI0006FA49D0|nr:LamG-like jellyroll fold domain-containing protein [Aeromicrobium sp. Root344]KQV75775.1 cellulosome enzyme [Aeromicrobium sp. Root344]